MAVYVSEIAYILANALERGIESRILLGNLPAGFANNFTRPPLLPD